MSKRIMNAKALRKKITIIMILGLTLGGVTYGVNMMNIVSQLKADSFESLDQLQETQRQLSELSDIYSQINSSGPRYTGNPFATELWPGQLQSENITGMHWYSYYGGELVNVTDNVLGEGDYTTWTHVWTRDYGVDITLRQIIVDNDGRCYVTDDNIGTGYIRDYNGDEQVATGHMFCTINFLQDGLTYSLTGKYVLSVYAGTDLGIWKQGVLTDLLDISIVLPDLGAIESFSISPNGKFIGATIESDAYKDRYMVLYEGS